MPSSAESMTEDSITSQMNEIDSFLQSLKVGSGLASLGVSQPAPPPLLGAGISGPSAEPAKVGQGSDSASSLTQSSSASAGDLVRCNFLLLGRSSYLSHLIWLRCDIVWSDVCKHCHYVVQLRI